MEIKNTSFAELLWELNISSYNVIKTLGIVLNNL